MSATVRASLSDLMRATVKQEPDWHYIQKRPLPLTLTTLETPVFIDCSGGIILLCKWAGAPSPTGKYDGYGNSQSFFYHLSGVPRNEVQAGDIIVYGRTDGEQHAVMVYEPGPDPLVWSHGQERGPALVRHSVELVAHPGAKATFLKLMPDPAPPVRVDVTRDGKRWKVAQKVSNPALWAAVRKAAGKARLVIKKS